MARTTPELIGTIIELDPAIQLDSFILPANALVTEICVPEGYDDERLELIERWLSAHFYCMRDPRPVSEGAGSVNETHQSRVDLFLSTSHYGQMACVLDTKGGLTILNAQRLKRKLQVSWLGTPPCP